MSLAGDPWQASVGSLSQEHRGTKSTVNPAGALPVQLYWGVHREQPFNVFTCVCERVRACMSWQGLLQRRLRLIHLLSLHQNKATHNTLICTSFHFFRADVYQTEWLNLPACANKTKSCYGLLLISKPFGSISSKVHFSYQYVLSVLAADYGWEQTMKDTNQLIKNKRMNKKGKKERKRTVLIHFF